MVFLWEKDIDPYLIEKYFDKSIEAIKPIFFDIETTGLGFTKSNFIFLIGLGYIIGRKFLIKQFVIDDKNKEAKMYDTIIEEINEGSILFTYNGEKFDVPLFLKRLEMHQKRKHIKKIRNLKHIDLLKMARRYWKKRIGSCSLNNVEKRILSISREDDLPGFLVPTYFEYYLKEIDMKYLNKILKHNRQDILSLYYILENIIREDFSYGKKEISLSPD